MPPSLRLIAGLVPAASVAALLPLAGARAQGVTTPIPLVESFDGSVEGLPLGWTTATSGELETRLSTDTRVAREGKGSWRIDVPAWSAGAARVRRSGLALKAGENYTVEVWLRAQGVGVPVELSLRSTPSATGGTATAPHLVKRFYVGPQWRRCVLTGEVEKDDANASVMLSLGGSGTLWVDALRLVAGELPLEPDDTSGQPPRKGNQIANSSFELGTDGWTLPEQLTLVKDTTPNGERFARWLPGRYPLEARPFRARPKQRYTVSAYLRSQRPGAKVSLAFTELGGAYRKAETFSLTTAWQRYAFTTTLPCEEYARYVLSLAPAEELHGFDVDAVQVEEGIVSNYAPASSIELTPGLSRAALYPRANEIMGIPVQVQAAGKMPEGAQLRFRLEGFYGETLGIGTAAIPEDKPSAEVPIRLRIPQWGTLRLILDAMVEGEVVSQSETLLTALPPAPSAANPDSFFGAHGTVGTSGEWLAPTVGARAGVRWWRLHELGAYTSWAVAEPEADRFRWFDREIDALRSRKLSLLGVLTRTPAWAIDAPGGPEVDAGALPPTRTSDAVDYAGKVAEHYRGRIAAYELWNEPWSRTYWNGSPERYVELAKGTAQAVRQADPGAVRVGGSFFAPQREFVDRVLAKGFLESVDRVSVHHYAEPESVTYSVGGRDEVTRYAQAIKGKVSLVTHGGAKAATLWNTEAGTPCPSFYTWAESNEASRAAARTVAKSLVLNKAAGVQRLFYYYLWHEAGPGRLFGQALSDNWSLMDYDGSGKPALAAYSACARALDGTTSAGRVETATFKAYAFSKGADTVVAAWSPVALADARELTVKLDPTRVSATNLMGNARGIWAVTPPGAPKNAVPSVAAIPLRNEPLYVQFRGIPAEAVLRALKSAVLKTAEGNRAAAPL